MAVIRLVAPVATVNELQERMAGDPDAGRVRMASPMPYRPALTERLPMGHVELVQILIDFGVGIAASAAYDMVKSRLEGLPFHRIDQDAEEPQTK